MKKDRNSFFQSSNFNMSASSSTPNFFNNQMVPMMNMPSYDTANLMNTQMYQTPNMNMAPNVLPINQAPNNYSELETRIAKLERSINRLDARINKLEGTTYYSKDSYESDGNMYMV